MPKDAPTCKGHDFSKDPNTVDSIMSSMLTTGFQATNLGMAIEQINAMRAWRLSDKPFDAKSEDELLRDPAVRSKIRARIFLSYTSNQISCGQRVR